MAKITEFPVDYSNLSASVSLQAFIIADFACRSMPEAAQAYLARLKERAVVRIKAACLGRPKDMYFYFMQVHHQDRSFWPDPPPRPEMCP